MRWTVATLACLAFGLFPALPAQADPVRITAGYYAIGEEADSFTFQVTTGPR